MDLLVPVERGLSEGTAMRYSAPSSPDCAVLDLSGAGFVDPFGLVVIASLAEAAVREGKEVDLRLPLNKSVRSYLARVHLKDAMDSLSIDCALEEVNEHSVGDRMLELTRFKQDEGVEELGGAVHRIFHEQNPQEAKDLYNGITEAALNACDHSGRDGGWAALQQYDRQDGRREVSFAVADSGVGLRGSLAPKHFVSTDREAIALAVKRGITSTDDSGRGLGLDTIVTRARVRKGHVRIWSGRSSAHTGVPAGSLYPQDHGCSFPGTVVYATLDYNSEVN
nr:hypothetical protein [uncultured Rhodococcus sp.]